MNVLIWNLIKQSGIDIGENQESNIEKFAELIVRECARIVDEKIEFDFSMGPDNWAEGEDLLKHFGVE